MPEPKLHPSNDQTRRCKTLQTEDVEKVGQAITILATELWAVKDRQYVTETVLKAHGIDTRAV